MSDNFSILQTSSGLTADVRGMIEQTRGQIARVVNAGMTLLYWRIGRRIQVEILGNQRAEYGQEIVATLAQDLMADFGRGFSKRNLFHMIRFADVFPNVGIVHSLSAQLGWTHFRDILPLKDPLQRDFYAEMCPLITPLMWWILRALSRNSEPHPDGRHEGKKIPQI